MVEVVEVAGLSAEMMRKVETRWARRQTLACFTVAVLTKCLSCGECLVWPL
ncbi:hypothetical protein GKJPGBOP_03411 [Streptomyces paromomycinus]|uniref:Uncharacterized protein n=1 Tax=Streptomyces paromomycinus TaxID=92743 RepID=A0A401W329_STREY|nr:hypothetical protein GKJPGBOP_03411 [Streptomyces paromomycinus]